MSVIALILLVALLIPIMGIVVDSPIGRALARRLEGPQEVPPGLAELAKKVDAARSRSRRSHPQRADAPGRERVPPAAARRPLSGPPSHRHPVPERPRRGPAASGGHGRRRHSAEPDRGAGPESRLRPLLRHLRRGGRVQRGVPDSQLPPESLRRRRTVGVVHSDIRRAAGAGRGRGGPHGVAGVVAALLGLAARCWCWSVSCSHRWLIDLIAPGFEGEKREATIRLVRILFPGAGLLVALGLVSRSTQQPPAASSSPTRRR